MSYQTDGFLKSATKSVSNRYKISGHVYKDRYLFKKLTITLKTSSSNLLCLPKLRLSSFDKLVATGSMGLEGSMHRFSRLVTRGIFLDLHPINCNRSTPQKFNSVILAGWSQGRPVVSRSKNTRLLMQTVDETVGETVEERFNETASGTDMVIEVQCD